MQIELTKAELEKFIDEQVRLGHFSSVNEVVEAALARLMLDPEPDELDAETLASIERAEAEFERGEDRPFEEVAADLRRKHFGK
jgi:Arc/MetJ-type ribon-helix-helix transcriptional regulator